MNAKLERMWTEMTEDLLKVLSQYFPGGTKENHNTLQSKQPPYGPRFKPGTSRIISRNENTQP